MDTLNLYGANMNFRRCGLSAGTTNTFTTTLDIHYTIKGNAYSAAAVTNAATPTTDANTGAAFVPVGPNKASVFVFCADGSGALAGATKVIQGSIVDLDGAADGANAGYVSALPQFPAIPDTLTPFGWVIVKVGASGTAWTFGSSNLSSVTNAAITFTAAATLPDRPKAA